MRLNSYYARLTWPGADSEMGTHDFLLVCWEFLRKELLEVKTPMEVKPPVVVLIFAILCVLWFYFSITTWVKKTLKIPWAVLLAVQIIAPDLRDELPSGTLIPSLMTYHGLPFLVGLALVKSVLQQDLAKDDKIKELEAEVEELTAQLSPAALTAARRARSPGPPRR